MRSQVIRKMVLGALFAAMAVILKSYGSIMIGNAQRISYFQIPLLLGGYFLGPLYGLITGFICDTVYAFTSTQATFFSIYTLSTVIWGPAGALIRKLSHEPAKHIPFIMVIGLTSVFQTAINTFGNYLYGYDPFASLVPRLIFMMVSIPMNIIIVRAIALQLIQIEDLRTVSAVRS